MPRSENTIGYVHSAFLSIEGEGNLVGTRALFVRLAGCDIACPYCDTPESWSAEPASFMVNYPEKILSLQNPIAAGDLISHLSPFVSDKPRYLCLTGGEPLLQTDFAYALADLAHHKLNLPAVLETSGLYPLELEPLLTVCSRINLDIKLPSLMKGIGHWESIRQSLSTARDSMMQVKVVVAANTSDAEIELAAQLVAAIEPFTPFVLQPVWSQAGFAPPDCRQLLAWQKIALNHLQDVRVIPQIHKYLGLP